MSELETRVVFIEACIGLLAAKAGLRGDMATMLLGTVAQLRKLHPDRAATFDSMAAPLLKQLQIEMFDPPA